MTQKGVSETSSLAQGKHAVGAANSPRVSIGIPVYNGDNYLEELLESLRVQTLEDFEVIISDNASTDRTADICRAYVVRDPRFRYFRNAKNIGAVRNYRCCFEPARAKYFKWANHDDIYTPTFLERCVDILDHHPEVVLAYTMVDAVDFTGRDLLKEHGDYAQIYARGAIESSRDSEGRLVWVSKPLHVAESTSPTRRFYDCLWQGALAIEYPLFGGVIRADVLRTVTLDEYYYGFDVALVLELALRGRFHQVEERCFINRFHLGCSRLLPARQIDKFANPEARVSMRKVRRYIAILRAPLNADLPLSQKISCELIGVSRLAYALVVTPFNRLRKNGS